MRVPIRFFTDEDVYGTVAVRRRQKGHDAVSTPDVDRFGEDDESQLAWATHEGRALVTFNDADFARIHQDWTKCARGHAGIIASCQRPIGDLLRRLLSLGSALGADEMRNRLEYLSNW